MTATHTDVDINVETYRGHRLSEGNEDAAHIVDQRLNKPAEERQDVAEAYIVGKEVTALCGARFVPTKTPESLPLCRACVETLERLARV